MNKFSGLVLVSIFALNALACTQETAKGADHVIYVEREAPTTPPPAATIVIQQPAPVPAPVAPAPQAPAQPSEPEQPATPPVEEPAAPQCVSDQDCAQFDNACLGFTCGNGTCFNTRSSCDNGVTDATYLEVTSLGDKSPANADGTLIWSSRDIYVTFNKPATNVSVTLYKEGSFTPIDVNAYYNPLLVQTTFALGVDGLQDHTWYRYVVTGLHAENGSVASKQGYFLAESTN